MLLACALGSNVVMAQTGVTCEPVAQRGDRTLGCYITARESLGHVPADAILYWHIDSFPTLAAAEAARSWPGNGRLFARQRLALHPG